jgi:hypothetical protein
VKDGTSSRGKNKSRISTGPLQIQPHPVQGLEDPFYSYEFTLLHLKVYMMPRGGYVTTLFKKIQ